VTTTASTERRDRWLVLLLAAVLTGIVTVLLGLSTAGTASAATVSSTSSTPPTSGSAAQTRVGVSASDVILVLGVRDVIAAGQSRGELSPQPQVVSGLCVAAEAGGGGAARSVALGLARGSDGEELLQPFADGRGALTNSQWIKEGLADEGPFEQRFAQATGRSIASGGRIQFNLDQFSITHGLEADTSEGAFGPGGVTNWEFQQVLNSPTLYPATDWWIGDEQIAGEDIGGFGLGPRF